MTKRSRLIGAGLMFVGWAGAGAIALSQGIDLLVERRGGWGYHELAESEAFSYTATVNPVLFGVVTMLIGALFVFVATVFLARLARHGNQPEHD